LENPIPNNPYSETLSKISSLFKNCLNFNVIEEISERKVKASGIVNFKPLSQMSFPSNPNEMQPPIAVPVMLEAEFFPEDNKEFKVSLRATDAKTVASGLLNLIKFYITPPSKSN